VKYGKRSRSDCEKARSLSTRRILGASQYASLCRGISSSLDVKRGRAPTVYTNFDGATSAVYMMVSNGAFPTA